MTLRALPWTDMHTMSATSARRYHTNNVFFHSKMLFRGLRINDWPSFQAYFGGEARCDAEAGQGDDYDPSELICGACSDVSRAQVSKWWLWESCHYYGQFTGNSFWFAGRGRKRLALHCMKVAKHVKCFLAGSSDFSESCHHCEVFIFSYHFGQD